MMYARYSESREKHIETEQIPTSRDVHFVFNGNINVIS